MRFRQRFIGALLSGTSPPPVDPGVGDRQTLPAPLSVVTVAPAALASTASSAAAGTQIRVTSGNLDNTTINIPNGTEQNPVVIVSDDCENPANMRRCTITGNGHAIICGIESDDRNLTGTGDTRSLRLSGSNKKLWYSDIAARRIGVALEQNNPVNIEIYRCHFFDQTTFTGNGDEAIKIGDQSDINRDMEIHIRENKISGFGSGSETISCKSAGILIEDLHMTGSRNIWARHGNGVTIRRANIESSLINTFCSGHVFENIIASEIRLCRGTEPSTNTADGAGSSYNACANTTVSNLTGLLRVNNEPFGAAWDNDASGCRWNNVGTPSLENGGGSDNLATTTTVAVEAIPTYSDTEVGISEYCRIIDTGTGGGNQSTGDILQPKTPTSVLQANPSNLASVVSSAPAGAQIQLASGDYEPGVLDAQNGTANSPITLLPANKNNPVRFLNRLVLRGDGMEIFGCTFESLDTDNRLIKSEGKNLVIAHCRLKPYGIAFAAEVNGAIGFRLHRCRFDGPKAASSGGSTGKSSIKYGGQTSTSLTLDMQGRIDWCRFEGPWNQREIYSGKARGMHMSDCHFINPDSTSRDVAERHGQAGLYERIRIEGGDDFILQGPDHVVRNIICRNVIFAEGTNDGDDITDSTSAFYLAAKRCTAQNLLEGTNLIIGDPPFGGSQFDTEPRDCTYSGVDGNVDNNGGTNNTATAPAISVETPPILAVTDVGMDSYCNNVVNAPTGSGPDYGSVVAFTLGDSPASHPLALSGNLSMPSDGPF